MPTATAVAVPSNKIVCPVCGKRKLRTNTQTFAQTVTLIRRTGIDRSEQVTVPAGVPVCWSHRPKE